MTTKNGNLKRKHKKILIFSSILIVMILAIAILILHQKNGKYKYCTIFPKKEAELCKKLIDTEGRLPYIDCMPCIYMSEETKKLCDKKSELCERAEKAGYPDIVE